MVISILYIVLLVLIIGLLVTNYILMHKKIKKNETIDAEKGSKYLGFHFMLLLNIMLQSLLTTGVVLGNATSDKKQAELKVLFGSTNSELIFSSILLILIVAIGIGGLFLILKTMRNSLHSENVNTESYGIIETISEFSMTLLVIITLWTLCGLTSILLM